VRAQSVQAVKAGRKAVQRFARQAKDQVGVYVGVRALKQPAQVVLALRVVLFARDAALHLDVEALHADLELQHARRELRDQVFQAIRQVIGDDFKMHEQFLCGDWHAVEKKLQDARRGVGLQVEAAIDKLELARATLIERVQVPKKDVQIEGPGALVECAQAKFALERAAARGFDVQLAMRQIVVGILGVRQRNLIERRLFADDHLWTGRGIVQEGAA